jgi:hypothetical protein
MYNYIITYLFYVYTGPSNVDKIPSASLISRMKSESEKLKKSDGSRMRSISDVGFEPDLGIVYRCSYVFEFIFKYHIYMYIYIFLLI